MKMVYSMLAAFTLFLSPGFTGSAAKAAPLAEGSKGSEVIHIQTILNQMGYLQSGPTGFFGPLTTNAVKQFQRDFHIDAIGLVGPRTISRLNDVNRMAHIVNGEARGESYKGQVAIAAVILNRVESNQFPNTIHKVINQTNAFTALNDGQYYLEPSSSAYRAVKDAFLGSDPTNGSLYYYNPRLATDDWIFTRPVTKQIGNHVFAN
ncbi:cell wall hydrolase [Peribacillus saganii]|uniref:Cell wall hydrolase n=1 Tax=Peribacillus saganii TaxID=2303992 RepID=A0A372LE56_9BACI|nr:cell wall hydrolase [Peribacillus saganii]RFU64507.1 cell wall hydrolase [Peribacillus saganii]